MKKKHIMTAVRILIACAAVGYIVYSVNWTDQLDDHGNVVKVGIVNTLRHADVSLMITAGAVVGLIYPLTTTRWWMLMRARGLHVTWGKAFRLNMVGCLFNYAMPVGTVTGDVIKAFYAVKGSGRHADAVMTIIVDRVVGLVGLIVVALVIGLFTLDHPEARDVTTMVAIGAGVLAIGALIYFTRALHGVLRIDKWIGKLPGGKLFAKVDAAALAYRDHKSVLIMGIVISTLVHLCLIFSTALTGRALNIGHELGVLMTFLPVLFICAAIPVSPQGLGTTELLATALLAIKGVDGHVTNANAIIGMLLFWRLYQIAYSLVIGGPFLLKGDIHLHPQEAEAAASSTSDVDAVDATPAST